MPLLRVRVTNESTEFLTEVTNWCADQPGADVYISCEEISHKGVKHFHLIVDFNKTLSTFNQRFSKQFPQLVGNKSKSITEATEDLATNLRYVCKGHNHETDPVVLYSKISFELIAQYHKEYWENNLTHARQQTEKRITDMCATNREICANIKEKKRIKPWMEKITEEFEAQYKTDVIDGNKLEFTYDKKSITCITRFVLKKLGNSRKILDSFVIKRMVLGLLNAVTHGEDEVLTSYLIESAFPDL